MDWEHPKVDQELLKVDPGESTGSQICHLDWACIKFLNTMLKMSLLTDSSTSATQSAIKYDGIDDGGGK